MPKPGDTGDPPEVDLLTRTSAGDRAAFETIFSRHAATVYRFACQMTGSADAAADVTQDVFIAIAEGRVRFDPARGAFRTYLYGIARNLVRQHMRRSLLRMLDLTVLDDVAGQATDPVDAQQQRDRTALLRRAILSLPRVYREVVVLVELHDVSYDDAARIVGCPVGTIRSRLSRARRRLEATCRAAEARPGHDRGPVTSRARGLGLLRCATGILGGGRR